jgi:hypothetical protein
MTMEKTDLNKEQQLMYELIFDTKSEYEIFLMEYISEITNMESFTERTVSNLTQSGVKIKEQIFIMTKDKQSWILKIKR